MKRRLVVCQGSIQLIAASAAMLHHQQRFGGEYENHLVIAELGAREEDPFAQYLRRIAARLGDWSSIGAEPTETEYHELFLCREWQPLNRDLMHRHRHALKICYGDGIGFYLSQGYHAGDRPLAALKRRLKRAAELVVSPELGFDAGYFLCPGALGAREPMPAEAVAPALFHQILSRAKLALEAGVWPLLRARVAEARGTVLLTSHFSDWRMSESAELTAYREFLLERELTGAPLLVIKPHPRETFAKTQRLAAQLSDLYEEVIAVTEGDLFFTPAEVLLQDLESARLVTFGSTSLALAALYRREVHFGFGKTLVRRHFRSEHVSGRLRFEADLELATRRALS
jgi:hypothetical protein